MVSFLGFWRNSFPLIDIVASARDGLDFPTYPQAIYKKTNMEIFRFPK
jgi:hypothetical protein